MLTRSAPGTIRRPRRPLAPSFGARSPPRAERQQAHRTAARAARRRRRHTGPSRRRPVRRGTRPDRHPSCRRSVRRSRSIRSSPLAPTHRAPFSHPSRPRGIASGRLTTVFGAVAGTRSAWSTGRQVQSNQFRCNHFGRPHSRPGRCSFTQTATRVRWAMTRRAAISRLLSPAAIRPAISDSRRVSGGRTVTPPGASRSLDVGATDARMGCGFRRRPSANASSNRASPRASRVSFSASRGQRHSHVRFRAAPVPQRGRRTEQACRARAVLAPGRRSRQPVHPVRRGRHVGAAQVDFERFPDRSFPGSEIAAHRDFDHARAEERHRSVGIVLRLFAPASHRRQQLPGTGEIAAVAQCHGLDTVAALQIEQDLAALFGLDFGIRSRTCESPRAGRGRKVQRLTYSWGRCRRVPTLRDDLSDHVGVDRGAAAERRAPARSRGWRR